MKLSNRLKNVMLLNLFNAAALCITAQLLLIVQGQSSSFNVTGFIINFIVAWPCACLIGYFVPASRLGMAAIHALHLKPGFAFAFVMNFCVNLIFTLLMSAVMTLLNVVILGGGNFIAFFMAFLTNFVPMYIASFLVAWFAVPQVNKLFPYQQG